MKYQVRISRQAERDVDQTLRWFLDQRATKAAARWHARLLSRIGTLETRPQRCRFAEEAEDFGIELRELLFGRRPGTYRILFQITGQVVHILRIRHCARDSLSAEDF